MLRKLLPAFALLPVCVSALILPHTWFGILALLAHLLAVGTAFGPRLSPTASRPLQLGLGVMVSLALMSILGSLVYYSASVTTLSLLGVLGVISLAACAVSSPSDSPRPKFHFTNSDLILFGLGSLSLIGWWIVVAQTHVTEPIRSIWLIFPPVSLIALGLTTVCAGAILIRNQTTYLGVILLAGLLFSATALAAQTYGLGYGFDPFLHRATIAHIAEFGTITPKPLYYIGEYALELIGYKIFALPLFTLDVFLAPLLAALGITLVLANKHEARQSPAIVLGMLLFLPLAAFVQTTPQALAFIFTACALFSPTKPAYAAVIFALAAVITHPLAGIGALVYVVLLGLSQISAQYLALKRLSIGLVSLGAAIALPLAFALQAKLSHLTLSFNPGNLLALWKLPISAFLTTHYNAWGDLAYFFINNTFIIVCVLALIGLVLTNKKQSGWYVPALVAGAMFINFIVISLGFDFTFLIAYERLDFALRLLTLTTLFLLPYVAVFFTALWDVIKTKPVGLRVGLTVLLAIFFMSQVYGAYPRHDNYARSAGFNVGPSDLNAVHAIDKAAENQDYIVLGDQALAAAAVQEFGFKQYYHDDIFFYPIPTGGPLYQDFLSMVEAGPSLETVHSAMDLAGVNIVFFAVHDYWWQAPQIIENAKALADDWFALGEGDITVFKFSR